MLATAFPKAGSRCTGDDLSFCVWFPLFSKHREKQTAFFIVSKLPSAKMCLEKYLGP